MTPAPALLLILLAAPDLALAQQGRVSLSAMSYGERASFVPMENDQASTQRLLFLDLRAILDAERSLDDRLGFFGDARLRVTPDELSARGYQGGDERQLREAKLTWTGDSLRAAAGRQVLRDVDGLRVDGISTVWRLSSAHELGAFAGAYPDPLSRSLETDYRGRAGEIPVAGGAWLAYLTEAMHGSVGAAVLAPREAGLEGAEPTRALLSAAGYWRAADDLDVYHHALGAVDGREGAQLVSVQAGADWRAVDRVRLETSLSHMSTWAIGLYVKERLESADPDPGLGAPAQNNLTFVRIATDEARLGIDVEPFARFHLFSEARARRRSTLDVASLPPELSALPADEQLEGLFGLRHQRWLGFDASATLVAVRGRRTASWFASARLERALLDERLLVEVDAGAVRYRDRCPTELGLDPSCTGDTSGETVRAGAAIIVRPTRRWLALLDVRVGKNIASRPMEPLPEIVWHSVFGRAQVSF